jgi:hypothetical protein
MPKPVALVDIDRAGDFAAYKPEEGLPPLYPEREVKSRAGKT